MGGSNYIIQRLGERRPPHLGLWAGAAVSFIPQGGSTAKGEQNKMEKVKYTIAIDKDKAAILDSVQKNIGSSRKRLSERLIEWFAGLDLTDKNNVIQQMNSFPGEPISTTDPA